MLLVLTMWNCALNRASTCCSETRGCAVRLRVSQPEVFSPEQTKSTGKSLSCLPIPVNAFLRLVFSFFNKKDPLLGLSRSPHRERTVWAQVYTGVMLSVHAKVCGLLNTELPKWKAPVGQTSQQSKTLVIVQLGIQAFPLHFS